MNNFDKTIDQYFLATKTISSVRGLGPYPIESMTNHYWTIVEIPSLYSNRRMCLYSVNPLETVLEAEKIIYNNDNEGGYYFDNKGGYYYFDEPVFIVNRDGEAYVIIGVSTTNQDVLLVFRKDRECLDEKVKESYLEWSEIYKRDIPPWRNGSRAGLKTQWR